MQKSEAVEDFRACEEYKSMMDVVQSFEKFSVHFPGQSGDLDALNDLIGQSKNPSSSIPSSGSKAEEKSGVKSSDVEDLADFIAL
ncbi:unnamed protein product [Cochlearia groenlandica]